MCHGVFRPLYLTLVVVGFVATQSEFFAFLEIKGYCINHTFKHSQHLSPCRYRNQVALPARPLLGLICLFDVTSPNAPDSIGRYTEIGEMDRIHQEELLYVSDSLIFFAGSTKKSSRPYSLISRLYSCNFLAAQIDALLKASNETINRADLQVTL